MRKKITTPPLKVTASNSNTRVSTGRPIYEKKASSHAHTTIAVKNSNTRVYSSTVTALDNSTQLQRAPGNRGLNSMRMREAMVQRLRAQGICNSDVLKAMYAVPRHRFVDEALASRAYDDDALPIGSGQTISQPWVVAYMLEQALTGHAFKRILEIGTGCGYQAAVLSELAQRVYSIERIESLYVLAKSNLKSWHKRNISLVYGDGMQGLSEQAPFDAILLAAAGATIPEALIQQLAVGGVLLAPEGKIQQTLIKIERVSLDQWQRTELEPVRFVPLKSGVVGLVK